MHIQSPGIVRTVHSRIFKDLQTYSEILMHIQPQTQAHHWKRERRFPLSFLENQKRYPDFGKKGLDCVHLWVKFFIQNVVFSVSRRKNTKMFPCGVPFSCAWRSVYRNPLVPHISPPLSYPENVCLSNCTQALYFLQNTLL